MTKGRPLSNFWIWDFDIHLTFGFWHLALMDASFVTTHFLDPSLPHNAFRYAGPSSSLWSNPNRRPLVTNSLLPSLAHIQIENLEKSARLRKSRASAWSMATRLFLRSGSSLVKISTPSNRSSTGFLRRAMSSRAS